MIGLLILFGGALALGAFTFLDDSDDDAEPASDGPQISGTSSDDILTGTSRGEIIDAGAGNDVVSALGGADRIDLGDGNDTLFAGDGNDRAFGLGGSDIMTMGAGNDLANGGPGDDLIDGGDGDDTVLAGKGDDVLLGRAGNDSLDGFDGEDLIFGGTGTDVITGGIGDDVLAGGSDPFDGMDPRTAAAPDLAGLARALEDGQADTVDGGFGRDAIFLGAGDRVTGGANGDEFLLDYGAIPETETAATTITDFTAGQDIFVLLVPDTPDAPSITEQGVANLQRITPDGVLFDFDADDSQDVLLAGLTQKVATSDIVISR